MQVVDGGKMQYSLQWLDGASFLILMLEEHKKCVSVELLPSLRFCLASPLSLHSKHSLHDKTE